MRNRFPVYFHVDMTLLNPSGGRIRLDAALTQVLPQLGLRGRRRLWEWCRVTVNGAAKPYGYMVAHGDAVAVIPHEQTDPAAMDSSGHNGQTGQDWRDRQGEQHGQDGQREHPWPDGPSDQNKRVWQDTQGKEAGHGGQIFAQPNASGHGAGQEESWPVTERGRKSTPEVLAKIHTEERDWLPAIKLVVMSSEFFVFHKPAGLHTVHLPGSRECSLESCLPVFMNQHGDNLAAVCLEQGVVQESALPGHMSSAFSSPRLLTRLDRDTSGLVLAARTQEAEKRFRHMEEQGQVQKTYLAVVHGAPGNGLVKQALDMKKRRKTGVLPRLAEASRWTRYSGLAPLCFHGRRFSRDVSCGAVSGAIPDVVDNTCSGVAQTYATMIFAEGKTVEPVGANAAYSLVQVVIWRGARHQIRAHLAFCGHPLVGDALYGSGTQKEGLLPEKTVHLPSIRPFEKVGCDKQTMLEGSFFLHYGRIEMPGLIAWTMPDARWDIWTVPA